MAEMRKKLYHKRAQHTKESNLDFYLQELGKHYWVLYKEEILVDISSEKNHIDGNMENTSIVITSTRAGVK
jgi:hypothetical protein